MKSNARSSNLVWQVGITCLFIASLALSACGTSAPQMYTVGAVNLLPTMDSVVEGFKAGLTEAGYTEGQNLTFVYPGAAGNVDKLETALQELKTHNVNLIFAVTTPAALAAKQATAGTSTPVIFAAVTDPISDNLAQSLNQPGGALTGVLTGIPGSASEARRVDWLLKIAPNIQAIYLPHNPDDPVVAEGLTVVKDTASKLKIELILKEVRTIDEAQAATQDIPENADAIFILADRVTAALIDQWVNVSLEQRLPLSSPNASAVDFGVVMAYGSDFSAMGKQAARLADQVLKGAKPGNVPIEAPELFLAINLKTAKTIGLEIPEDILRQASTVIR